MDAYGVIRWSSGTTDGFVWSKRAKFENDEAGNGLTVVRRPSLRG